jgi:hypothetical protein
MKITLSVLSRPYLVTIEKQVIEIREQQAGSAGH